MGVVLPGRVSVIAKVHGSIRAGHPGLLRFCGVCVRGRSISVAANSYVCRLLMLWLGYHRLFLFFGLVLWYSLAGCCVSSRIPGLLLFCSACTDNLGKFWVCCFCGFMRGVLPPLSLKIAVFVGC